MWYPFPGKFQKKCTYHQIKDLPTSLVVDFYSQSLSRKKEISGKESWTKHSCPCNALVCKHKCCACWSLHKNLYSSNQSMQNSNNAREYQEGTLDEAKHSWHSNFQFAIANENIARADHFPEGRCIPVFLPSAHNLYLCFPPTNTPSQIPNTPSQIPNKPSQIPNTPSQNQNTPYQVSNTPYQIQNTQSHTLLQNTSLLEEYIMDCESNCLR